MNKIIWLVVLLIPGLVALEFDAPKWLYMLLFVPFWLLAMSLDDSDEHLLGDATSPIRNWLLAFIGIGGLILGIVVWSLAKAVLPH